MNRPFSGRRLLCVFAHPDDESYGPAGTVARYVALGAEAELICATRGEAGTIGRSSEHPPDQLAAIRERELRAAVAVIGYRRLHILGYPDGGVDRIDAGRGVRDIESIVRDLRPDVVIAFHPLGISGHSDHRTMTRFARSAVARLPAGDGARPALHYYTLPASVVRAIQFRTMPLVPDEEIHVEIDTSGFADVKRRAIECHHTQLDFFRRLEQTPGGAARFERELFTTEGVPGPVRRRRRELLD